MNKNLNTSLFVGSPTCLKVGHSRICASQTGPGSSEIDVREDETETGGNGGDGPPDNGNDNSNRNNDGNDDDGEEFLNLQQAEELAAAKGMRLPEDYAAAARDGGLRLSVLQQYLVISSGSLLTGVLARSVPAFRDRLIADRMYFFKILAEISIDSGDYCCMYTSWLKMVKTKALSKDGCTHFI